MRKESAQRPFLADFLREEPEENRTESGDGLTIALNVDGDNLRWDNVELEPSDRDPAEMTFRRLCDLNQKPKTVRLVFGNPDQVPNKIELEPTVYQNGTTGFAGRLKVGSISYRGNFNPTKSGGEYGLTFGVRDNQAKRELPPKWRDTLTG